jgi:hypothetical protein
MKDTVDYWYHGTLISNLLNIYDKGLLPSTQPNWDGKLRDSSLGKIFFAASQDSAQYYVNILLKLDENRNNIPIMLRCSSKDIESQLTFDYDGDIEAFSQNDIPTSLIQILWDNTWQCLKDIPRKLIEDYIYSDYSDDTFYD